MLGYWQPIPKTLLIDFAKNNYILNQSRRILTKNQTTIEFSACFFRLENIDECRSSKGHTSNPEISKNFNCQSFNSYFVLGCVAVSGETS